MNNWEEIVNGIEAPKGVTPSEWVALEGPKSKEAPVTLGSPIEAFLAKYKIAELGRSQVALTLPAGISRIEFLKEAQELSIVLHASDPEVYWRSQAIFPDSLKSWESERGFIGRTDKELLLRIDGNVKDSTGHIRKEQQDRGWNDVALQDLAVAHTAFYLLTRKDLFEFNLVRARGAGCALQNLHKDGLSVVFVNDDYRSSQVSASRCLAVPK